MKKLAITLLWTLTLIGCGGETKNEELETSKELPPVSSVPDNSQDTSVVELDDSADETRSEESEHSDVHEETEQDLQEPGVEEPVTEEPPLEVDLSVAAPKGLNVQFTENKVTLNWAPVYGAQAYYVYSDEQSITDSANTFEYVESNSFSFVVSSNEQSQVYFKVQAIFVDSLSPLSSSMNVDVQDHSRIISDK